MPKRRKTKSKGRVFIVRNLKDGIIHIIFLNIRNGLEKETSAWFDGEGDARAMDMAKGRIADIFCHEAVGHNWLIPIDGLGASEYDATEDSLDVNNDMFEGESTKFKEDMYKYGSENLIKLNMYIR